MNRLISLFSLVIVCLALVSDTLNADILLDSNYDPKMTKVIDNYNGHKGDYIPKGQEKLISLSPSEVACLEVALWYEARGENKNVIELVASTIIERSNHPEFPNDVCKVISQPGQFSFITEAKGGKNSLDLAKKGKDGLPKVKSKVNKAAKNKIKNVVSDIVGNKIRHKRVTHFHDNSIKKLPKWTKKFPLVAKAGNMKFYRMP